jgi:hypothetical protein
MGNRGGLTVDISEVTFLAEGQNLLFRNPEVRAQQIMNPITEQPWLEAQSSRTMG